jgi:soluble lytic murein transglycosylase-like protein
MKIFVLLVLAMNLYAVDVVFWEKKIVSTPTKDYALLKHIEKECKINDVPFPLVAALITAENSIWNPLAKGYNRSTQSYDWGLMQINSKYWASFVRDYGEKGVKYNAFNAKDSATIGIRHLRWLYTKTSNWTLAIVAYNCGLNRMLSNRIPMETIGYLEKVTSAIPFAVLYPKNEFTLPVYTNYITYCKFN